MNKQTGDNTKKTGQDLEPKVTGIGGIFFFSEDPKAASAWYKDKLGMETNDWGASFESKDCSNPEIVLTTQWSPFKKGSDYFSPSKKEFMINYRVQNIEGLVRQLRDKGVSILDEIASYEYGKFVHIMDQEGNKIELWEPA